MFSQGYTIPLDKRLAADGRGLQQVHINENFAKLAEALYIADRKVSYVRKSFYDNKYTTRSILMFVFQWHDLAHQ